MQSKRESRYEMLLRSRRPIHHMSRGESCAYLVRRLVWLYVAGLAQTGCPFKITMTWRVGAPNPTITSVRIDNSWLGMCLRNTPSDYYVVRAAMVDSRGITTAVGP